jgi:hypothetical protein
MSVGVNARSPCSAGTHTRIIGVQLGNEEPEQRDTHLLLDDLALFEPLHRGRHAPESRIHRICHGIAV